MDKKIAIFQKQLEESQNIVFFGGAGVSTESGIPDFRSSEGIYMQETKGHVSAEEMISHTFYKRYPKEFFKYYFENLVFDEAEPNAGHLFLSDLEKTGKNFSVVTQNIDGLHQKAGSKIVHELHGSVLRNYCETCQTQYTLSELEKDGGGVPRCPKDNGIVRPDIVLYEEGLDQNVMQHAITDIKAADMLIIAGTSLVVYPAAGLINYFNGDYLIAINKTPLQVPSNTLMFEDSISKVFAELTI